jgi:hypothetical protein
MRWWEESDMDIVMEDAALYKSLYGDTAAKVYYDEDEGLPKVDVVSSPENMYVGYGSSNFQEMDWVIYHYGLSPQAVEEEFDLKVMPVQSDGQYYPYVHSADHSDPLAQAWGSMAERTVDRRDTAYERMQVGVYDYWYKKQDGDTEQVYNAVFIGNKMVKNEQRPEYGGTLPYIPLINSRIPGSPYGKPELYDIEQLLREKDERITQAAQFIQQVDVPVDWTGCTRGSTV